MMKEIIVNTYTKQYSIIISQDYSEFIERISTYKCKYIVITDNNVAKLHLHTFIKCIETKAIDVIPYVIEAGEEAKSIQKYYEIIDFLAKQKITRNDLIITFGGGVIGDLGGFVASTYKRGVKLIHVPTSLLAQVDSSIGGKTGINYMKFKNYIGTFYQPELVYINHSLLHTLPIDELRNGLVEVLVHSIIKDVKLFDYLENNIKEILSNNICFEELIYTSCLIKAKVVEKDENENGERAILNFGHTIGHAIESTFDYKHSHGKCVSWGILGACILSEEYKLIDKTITERIYRLLQRIGCLIDISKVDIERVLFYIKQDKKNTNNNIYFILLNEIGDVSKYLVSDEAILVKVLKRITVFS